MFICQNNSQQNGCERQALQSPKSIFFNVGKKSMRRQKPLKYWQNMQAIKQSSYSQKHQAQSEDKIKQSDQYKNIVNKISYLERLSLNEAKLHQQSLNKVNSLIDQQRESIYNLKLNIWELRNQVMGLQQLQENQIEYEQELKRDLGQLAEEENQCQQIKLNQMFSSQNSQGNKQQNGSENLCKSEEQIYCIQSQI